MSDWQLVTAILLVAFASGYIAWKTWRTWHPPKGSCGGSCGCAIQAPAAETQHTNLIPPDQLTFRQRHP